MDRAKFVADHGETDAGHEGLVAGAERDGRGRHG
jgi:hypothetical protein